MLSPVCDVAHILSILTSFGLYQQIFHKSLQYQIPPKAIQW